MSRGWVFQERLLAPRVAHFTDKQVVWECRQGAKAELLYPSDHPEHFHHSLQQRLATLLDKDDCLTAKDILHFWRWVVQLYSQTVTTFERDRLFAMAGIASLFQNYLWEQVKVPVKRGYVVGMWKQDLEFHLGWVADDRNYLNGKALANLESARPQLYRAPSWSWASVNGPVHFEYPNDIRMGLIEVPDNGIDIRITGSIFGSAELGSRFSLWTNLCRARLREEQHSYSTNLHLELYSWNLEPGSHLQDRVLYADNGQMALRVYWDERQLAPEHMSVMMDNLYCMPLCITGDIGSDMKPSMWCLGPLDDQHFLDRSREHQSYTTQYYLTSENLFSAFDGDDHAAAKSDGTQLAAEDSSGDSVDVEEKDGSGDSDSSSSKSSPWVDPERYLFSALLLSRVDGQKGQYQRVGIMFTDAWTRENIGEARAFASAFRNTGLSSMDGDVLPVAHPRDPSVHLIEII